LCTAGLNPASEKRKKNDFAKRGGFSGSSHCSLCPWLSRL
jgi:hypothetical protein